MINLPPKFRHAVNLLVYLTKHTGTANTPINLTDMARSARISVSYGELLFVHLLDAGIVRSRRGPNGGYTLGKPARETTFTMIAEALAPLFNDKPIDGHWVRFSHRVDKALRVIGNTTTLHSFITGEE